MNCSEEVQIAGSIKQNVDDFIVEEIPLYEPCGEGEHLYICIQKTNMSHDQLIRSVAAEFGVSIKAVGYAGRKDLRAVTRQSLSVHLPGQKPEITNAVGISKCCHLLGTQISCGSDTCQEIDLSFAFVK